MTETKILRPFGTKPLITREKAPAPPEGFTLFTLPEPPARIEIDPLPEPDFAAAISPANEEDFKLLALHLLAKARGQEGLRLGILASGKVDLARFAQGLSLALDEIAPQIEVLPFASLGDYIALRGEISALLILRQADRRDRRLALLPHPIWGIVEEPRALWPLPLFGSVTGLLLGALLWVMASPQYEAEALLQMHPGQMLAQSEAPNAFLTAQLQMALSDEGLDAILAQEPLYSDQPQEMRRQLLRDGLTVSSGPELVSLKMRAASAETAARLANALGDQILERSVQNQMQHAQEELAFYRAYVPEAVAAAETNLRLIEAKKAPHFAWLARAQNPLRPEAGRHWLWPLAMAGLGAALGVAALRPWRKSDALLRLSKRKGPG